MTSSPTDSHTASHYRQIMDHLLSDFYLLSHYMDQRKKIVIKLFEMFSHRAWKTKQINFRWLQAKFGSNLWSDTQFDCNQSMQQKQLQMTSYDWPLKTV